MSNPHIHEIAVEGMTCGNCALTISRYLDKKGMTGVSANASTGTVRFTAPEDADLQRIFKGIDELGYKVIQADEEGEGHMHAHPGNRRLKIMLLISAVFTLPLLLHMFLPHTHILNNPYLQLGLCLPVFLIGIYHFGGSAIRSLRNGIPNMDVLITLGASAAFFYSLAGMVFFMGDVHRFLFFETTATIITLVLLGNWIEHKTVTATTSAIKDLARLQPDRAKLILVDSLGKETLIDTESKYLKVNDLVLAGDGARIPVDGLVTGGRASVDESMMTGESIPVEKSPGDSVIGGAVVLSGSLKVKATAIGASTALANIIQLVKEAQAAKPPMQKLADKISAVFVPLVLCIALITFLGNFFLGKIELAESIMRAVAVLVIACPCAMGLATPAAVAVGLGRAARNGVLIKGGDTLEKFKDIRQIVFDKTGTLTTGDLRIRGLKVQDVSEAFFTSVVAEMEKVSNHPIAQSIRKQWSNTENITFQKIEETKGSGLEAWTEAGDHWKLGSGKIWPDPSYTEFDLHLLKNKQWVGGIQLEDVLRPDARDTLEQLRKRNFETVLLSGDRKEKVETVGKQLNFDQIYGGQMPGEKMQRLEQLLKVDGTAMVGDGINDAPALARADIGISLSDATQVAMQSADVVLSNNRLSTLPKAIRLGLYTYQTIRQNLFWAFFYNVFAIPLAAFGYLSPMWAALFMAFSDVVLVLNSLRLNYRKIDGD